MSGHTPGPWEVLQPHQTSGWGFCVEGDGAVIAQMKGRTGQETRRANARLIAAAPELLKALEELAAWFDRTDAKSAHSALRKAERAIAKARGTNEGVPGRAA